MTKNKQIIFEIKKITKKKWSKEQDQVLYNILDFTKRGKWKFASMMLNNQKTPLECFHRFKKLNDNFYKGKWTKDEDEKLKKLVEKHGKKWKFISTLLGNRSNKQVRNRFIDYLDEKILSTKFTKFEDKSIFEIYLEHGLNRNIFLEKINGRSFRQIRNRVTYLLKKVKKSINDKTYKNKNENNSSIANNNIYNFNNSTSL